MLQTGGGAPLPGRGLSAHSRSRPCVLPVRIFDSVCELVVPPAGCLRRPGRFAPGPQTGRVPVPTAALPPCNSGQLRLTGFVSWSVRTHAGCLRRPGRFAPLRARTGRPCPRPGRYAPCGNRAFAYFFRNPSIFFPISLYINEIEERIAVQCLKRYRYAGRRSII